MGRLWQSGFETGNTTNGIEWTAWATTAVQTSIVRSGTYAYKVGGPLVSGVQHRVRHQFAASNSNGPFFARVYVYFATLPSVQSKFFGLGNNTNPTGSGCSAYLTIDNTGAVRLFDEDGQIGSASSALSTGQWYCFEIYFDRTGSAGSHIVKARIDEVEFAGATNRDVALGVYQFHVGGNMNGESNSVGEWYFDDAALNDSTGSFQNSYPGKGHIIALKPNGAGDTSDWTGDYTAVDDVSPNDGTDYLESNTLDQVEDMNIEDPSAMGASDTVNVVAVRARFARNATGGGSPAFVTRVKAAPAGTVDESVAIAPTATTYSSDKVSTPLTLCHVIYDLPGASTTPWSKSDVQNAQIGVRTSTGATDANRVTKLWMEVDYVEAVGASTVVKDVIGSKIIPGSR